MNENPEAPGYYWVKEDLGEGKISEDWEPAAWDGKNWWGTFRNASNNDSLVYVAVVGKRITVAEEL